MAKNASLVRLDALLVKRGMAGSRQRAQEMIRAGDVTVDGLVAKKPATQVRSNQAIELTNKDFPWVGRGALKLLGVLSPFHIQPDQKVCADLGSSTGGFTQVLLENGATKVYAIDVGKGQLAWKLRTDPRVVVMEETNARHLESLPEPIDLVVGDLSFISLRLILPAVKRLMRKDGDAVLLIKPQFEAGKHAIKKGGKVASETVRTETIESVLEAAQHLGFLVVQGTDCTVPGAKAGNVEYFVHLRAQNTHEK
jgi:23S rRNA (cytidine1920-2'-O)/16S rRNA (cytidine1409-2'-O)-methyltransferase